MKESNQTEQWPAVPAEFAGQWIAWNHDRSRIVGQGRTATEALQRASRAGEDRPLLEKVPPADAVFIGGTR